ncbi:membrane protein [Neisseria arctica]|uniref:Membrane protein n=1 Tax=Neisseria arctica TaxID=1470200 RepID=A0A0J0YTC5_9NEIS|nr:membrane protein [Neisseria arctica]KLT73346.1 membrane protein [Neisseria arctica]UOO87388.1 YitT family protein [Neisseria arctica]
MKNNGKVLPRTPWSANHLWEFSTKPFTVLLLSLVLFGIGEGLLVIAQLGSTPWTVLAQGISASSGIHLGWTTFWISVAVLLAWIPLHQRPGLGTMMNILVIAATLGIFVQYIQPVNSFWQQLAACVAGVTIVGIASALYLTCHLGAGPRDGLMVGLCRAIGWRVGLVRTLIEGGVCLVGWLLGGAVGLGTLLFAFGVGWVVQAALQFLARHYNTECHSE